MLDLITKHEDFIKSFHVLLYEQEEKLLRFKAQLIFIDDSKLFIKEYIFESQERKYAYHWTDSSENLICRWDNASHWPDISTFPHHKHHSDNQVFKSTAISLDDVLSYIIKTLK